MYQVAAEGFFISSRDLSIHRALPSQQDLAPHASGQENLAREASSFRTMTSLDLTFSPYEKASLPARSSGCEHAHRQEKCSPTAFLYLQVTLGSVQYCDSIAGCDGHKYSECNSGSATVSHRVRSDNRTRAQPLSRKTWDYCRGRAQLSDVTLWMCVRQRTA